MGETISSRCPLSANVSDLGPVILNELVKRSTREVFYDFITKYTEILLKKNEEKLLHCKSFSHFFNKNCWHTNIIVEKLPSENLTKR